MRRKKVLVHGTPDSLQKFFNDASAADFDVVAVLSDAPEEISVEDDGKTVEVFSPKNLPKFVLNLVDGIIFTDTQTNLIGFFLKQGIAPRKIILWDADKGWGALNLPDSTGTPAVYFYGLEFHIRDADKEFFTMAQAYIQNQWLSKNLGPKFYVDIAKKIFQQRTGKTIDFENPRTLTEKLQWLKIFDATPIKSRLSDKYLVRSWIADKIGDEYLIPLLGVWDSADDIDFDALPNQFVLKCNHGSNMNIIVRDKRNFDKNRAREKFSAWLVEDFAARHFELHYTRINRKIIAEKFMTDGVATDLVDYKFWCFDGKPVLVQCETDRSIDLKFNYFDMDFNPTNIERSDHKMGDNPEKIPPPKNFELMKKLAATLAEGFAFVRVDFYEINGRVYFGEMTFTPGAGDFYFKSAGTDEWLGSLLKLPNPTPPPILGSKEYFFTNP